MEYISKRKNLLFALFLVFAISFFAFINLNNVSATTNVMENVISDEITYFGKDSSPSGFKSFNGWLYFSAASTAYGTELWRTDGTNTSLVADINPGTLGGLDYAEPGLTELSSWLYFVANDGTSGTELWRTNGVTTEIVRDINPGSNNSSPFGLTVFDGQIYFAADDGTNGMELWRTNGVTTQLVSNINPGSADSAPFGFAVLGSWLYFAADDGTNGVELWRTNGATTEIVRNINPGSADSTPTGLTVFGSWIYFAANDGTNGVELWRTNGATTELVSNINSGSADSSPTNFKEFSGWLYFAASNGTNGTEPWRTNGVTTEIVRDINSGSGNSVLSESGDIFTGFVELGSWLYFPAGDGVHGFEPWRTNGTTTELVTDINLGRIGSNDVYYPDSLKFVESNNWLYFVAKATSSNLALWRTNGTTTEEVSSSSLDSYYGSEVKGITEYNGMIYFSMKSFEYGAELYRSDGSSAVMVDDINTGIGSAQFSFGAPFAEYLNQLYFTGDSGHSNVWRTDGATLNQVTNINASGDAAPFSYISCGGLLYFIADNGSDQDIYYFDGSTSTRIAVPTLNYDVTLTCFNNWIYFAADNGTNGLELWRTNSVTTEMVRDIRSGVNGSSPKNFNAIGSWLYFSANDGTNGTELWRTNGVTTSMVSNINTSGSSDPGSSMVQLGSYVYFSAQDATHGVELWRTDGVTTAMVMDIYSGASNSNPSEFTLFGGWLYFTADDGIHGTEVWRTDGATTELVDDINPSGPSVFWEAGFKELNNWLYFAAYDGTNGFEPWRTNGTTTEIVADINPVGSGSMPSTYTVFNDYLYFTASHSFGGRELWRTNGSSTENVYALTGNGYYNYFADFDNSLLFNDGSLLKKYFQVNSPILATTTISSITETSVTASSTVFDDGNSTSTAHGFVYSTSTPNPTTSSNGGILTISSSFWTGDYSSSLTGLSCGSTYYIRSYSTNLDSTGYGATSSFITSACTCPTVLHAATYNSYPTCGPATCDSGYEVAGSLCSIIKTVPILAGTDISSTTETAIMASSTVLDDGNGTSTVHGFVYSKTSTNPTTSSNDGILTISGNFWTGQYSSGISGLACATLYYIRSYSTNVASTGYGSTASFTTSACTCSSVAHAATYYAYPTCGPATCVSGYNVSGGQCVAISSGGGSGGVSIVVPATVPQVSNLILNAGDSKIDLSWTNPAGSSNFSGVKILRKMLSAPNSATDSTAVTIYTGAGNNFTDTGLINSQKYYYGVYSYNGANYSSAVTISGTPMFGIVINPNQATSTQVVNSTSSVPLANNNPNSLVGVQSVQAGEIIKSEVQEFMIDPQFVNLVGVEKTVYLKTIALGKADLADNNKKLIADFIHSGTPTTIILGAGERAGCVSSFSLAFGRLPESETDWQDVVKIANGRWPGQKNQVAEDSAKVNFKKVYGRNPNMSNQNDNAAVTVMAYGLRPANRNMNSEANSIKSFKYYFKRNPTTASEWDVVRAIAYSGAKR